jgi:transcriptional regulator with XRE-family HTH domain
MKNIDPIDTDENFTKMFKTGVGLLTISRDDIADIFLVSRPTIARWMRGQNLPHPALRRSIRLQMAMLIDQLIERL